MPGAPRIPAREGGYQFNSGVGLGVLPAYGSSGLGDVMPDDIQPLQNIQGNPLPPRASPVAAPPAMAVPSAYDPVAPRAQPNYPQPGGAYPTVLGGPENYRSNAMSGGGIPAINRTDLFAPQAGPFEKLWKTIGGMFNGGNSPENAGTATPNGMAARPNVGSGMGQQGSLGFWGNAFPGSLIGSFAQGTTAPATGRGYISHSTAMPGYARVAYNNVRARNIA